MIIIYNYIVSDYCTHHAKASNRVERMTTRFIGPADRLTLAKKPQRAIHCWQDEFNSGQSFFKQAMWTMALPHAGRAFEIAEILLGSDTVESANGCAHCRDDAHLAWVGSRRGEPTTDDEAHRWQQHRNEARKWLESGKCTVNSCEHWKDRNSLEFVRIPRTV